MATPPEAPRQRLQPSHPRRRALSRLVPCVAALSLLAVVAACGSHDKGAGKALAGDRSTEGESSVGFPTADIKAGHRLGFSFPSMYNQSSKPITVLGVSLLNIPNGIRVDKYTYVNYHQTGEAQLLSSRIGPGDDEDYSSFQNRPMSDPVVIPPHQQSYFYPVVYLTVTGDVTGHASGCRFVYRLGTRMFHETLGCEFDFGDDD